MIQTLNKIDKKKNRCNKINAIPIISTRKIWEIVHMSGNRVNVFEHSNMRHHTCVYCVLCMHSIHINSMNRCLFFVQFCLESEIYITTKESKIF